MSEIKMKRLLVNGEPSCCSELTRGLAVGCTAENETWLRRWADMILKAHPDAKITIVEGRCTVNYSQAQIKQLFSFTLH